MNKPGRINWYEISSSLKSSITNFLSKFYKRFSSFLRNFPKTESYWRSLNGRGRNVSTITNRINQCLVLLIFHPREKPKKALYNNRFYGFIVSGSKLSCKKTVFCINFIIIIISGYMNFNNNIFSRLALCQLDIVNKAF